MLGNYRYTTYSGQSGFSLLQWLVVIVIFVFLAQLAIKLAPVYVESYSVKKLLMGLSQRDDISDLSAIQLREAVNKGLSVNQIGGNVSQSFKVKPSDQKFLVSFDYEKRLPFIANIDIVISFNYLLDTSNPQACCNP